jgi:hypothetical protein
MSVDFPDQERRSFRLYLRHRNARHGFRYCDSLSENVREDDTTESIATVEHFSGA